MKWIIVMIALSAIAFSTFVMWHAHKDDARLRAECEARGGTFVEARSPMHTCVAERTT
jgi:hypothetical protein